MQLVLTILARLGLVLTILPSVLYLFGAIELSAVKWIMIAGMVLWLAATPIIQKQHQEKMAHDANRDNL